MPTSSSRAAELDATGVDHLLGYLLALAEVPTRRAFRQHVGEPFALRPVEFTLLIMLQVNQRASATQIRHALRMPAPHVTTLVDRLRARGLVQRTRDPHDGRAVRITLTPAGHALAGRLQAVSAHMEDGVQAVLTAAERTQLRQLLAKLAGSVRPGA
jgi:DNA-binding MarR family transcriptional regulator